MDECLYRERKIFRRIFPRILTKIIWEFIGTLYSDSSTNTYQSYNQEKHIIFRIETFWWRTVEGYLDNSLSFLGSQRVLLLERCLIKQAEFQEGSHPELWLSGRQMGCCRCTYKRRCCSMMKALGLGSYHLLLSDPVRAAWPVFMK